MIDTSSPAYLWAQRQRKLDVLPLSKEEVELIRQHRQVTNTTTQFSQPLQKINNQSH